MMVLVRWCCNVDCHSVGRVPSSYPRCVRCPTALLRFYPIPFLFVVSVCRGGVRFGFSIPCPSSLSFWSFPLVSACTWFRFLFPLPLVFMYCIKVFCTAFFLSFRFTLLPLPSGLVWSLSFLFPLFWCSSLGSLRLWSACLLLSYFSVL